ncbi:MAG: MmcQ/YjbR family DNA-binding protein [Bacteroidetes bacterium]|nr:MmcQ/YjbR family DNA-binding protein [Bacteroidota bacterium]
MIPLDSIREFCLSFPMTKEDIPWEDVLTFKVAGKIFAVVNLDYPHFLSIKCTTENFDSFLEYEHIKQAPYFARRHWIFIDLQQHNDLTALKDWITESFNLVIIKTPAKTRIKIEKMLK